jgi:tRNA/rRNA methyltransferase
MSCIDSLARIRVVLVRPSHPGNIGATARAMQTMGLSKLVLVDPQRFPDPEAMAMAANATAVLDDATVCTVLDDALRGTVLQVAFSARSRALSHTPLTPREGAAALLDVLEATRATADVEIPDVALVFGNETYGLSNEEVMRCNRLVSIPTDPDSSSLNLAASVQVACYELRMAALERDVTPGAAKSRPTAVEAIELARHEDVERFLVHLEASLYKSGFLQPGNPRRLLERMRRLFSRAGLQVEEVNILRGMLTLWDEPMPPAKAVEQAAKSTSQSTPKRIVDKSTRK